MLDLKKHGRSQPDHRFFFSLDNPIPGNSILFEPSLKLPECIRGVPTLSSGKVMRIRLDNSSEEDQLIDPGWEIGTAQQVQIEEATAATEGSRAELPGIPRELNAIQKEELENLLKKY